MQKNALHSNITSMPETKYMITIYRISPARIFVCGYDIQIQYRIHFGRVM